jgi:2-polyprenyl-6-methoxyphenol hydroxylase-like FAD-dependent oxidoreductase
MDVVILGAGPCGISAAIALAKITAEDPNTMPLHITLVELRPRLQTKGGTVNITPLGMRYIDYLGAGSRLRARSISLDHGVDLVSLRTGRRLGTSWGGIGGRRTARYPLAQSLLETLRQSHPEVRIQWGRNVMAISESDDKVELKFDDQSMLLCDLLLGCDGIHSAARRLYVEPSREKAYTGRAVAMGWVDSVGGSTAPSPITLANGEPGLIDTVGIKGSQSVLIMTYFEPSRSKVFFANAMQADEPREGGDRDGWKILGANQDAIRQEVLNSYSNGYVSGLEDTLAKCENWDLYPIYALPPGGIWSKGRVLLLGDAAHAVSR